MMTLLIRWFVTFVQTFWRKPVSTPPLSRITQILLDRTEDALFISHAYLAGAPQHSGSAYVPKEWGAEIWKVNNELYCAKFLYLEPGFQCSLHRHLKKDETFCVVRGQCRLEVEDRTVEMRVGDSERIVPGKWHRFSNNRYNQMCVILEVSTHHDEADVERKEPSGRID